MFGNVGVETLPATGAARRKVCYARGPKVKTTVGKPLTIGVLQMP